jgi:hypothetical protein
MNIANYQLEKMQSASSPCSQVERPTKSSANLALGRLKKISDNGTYDAVSYCWGALDATMKIHVQDEGRSNTGIVAVKPNLYAALQVFRHEKEARKLWIDAICIDQTNNEEKNVQATLMRV